MPRLALLGLLLVSTGCPNGDDGPCGIGVVGDPALGAEMQVVARHGSAQEGDPGTMVPIADGDRIPAIFPPQQGYVVFLGARVRNVDTCHLYVKTSVVDPCNDSRLHVRRQPVFLRLAEDGWAEPRDPDDISAFGNLEVCPSQGQVRDLEEEEYRFEISVVTVNSDGTEVLHAEEVLNLTPYCAEPARLEDCLCQCDRDYSLGTVCAPDADGGPGCP